MAKRSLFLGRWQTPYLHEGHLALFDEPRKRGNKIIIGVRDTDLDRNNPYTAEERVRMIRAQVPDAEVFVLPDFDEICYGRDVGYGIRRIRLDAETEKISATEIRRASIQEV